MNEHGIDPAPERGKHTSWSTFLRAHWESIAPTDFFTVDVLTLRGLVTYYVLCGYATSGTNSVRPHAVTTAGSNTYGYDANGNMNQRNGSAISWYSYNLPNRIDKGSSYSQFFYDAGRSRYKQIAVTAAGGPLPARTETTVYVDGLFEKVTKPSGVTEYKHYIMAGAETVALRTLRTNSADDTRYLHKDHLGSVDVITNDSGAVVQRLSYDAFGKRRSATAWSGSLAAGDWTSIAAIMRIPSKSASTTVRISGRHIRRRQLEPCI